MLGNVRRTSAESILNRSDSAADTGSTNVVVTATQNGEFSSFTGYEGFATATIDTARARYGTDSPVVQAITHAWYAVNVSEDLLDTDIPTVTPARNAPFINPWQHFLWPVQADVKLWDVQITRNAFDAGPVEFEADAVKAERVDSELGENLPVGFLSVALPYESSDRWFWRVRPHSDDAWADCYPIHSFLGTSTPGDIHDVQVFGKKDSAGNYPAGSLAFGWDLVDGATEYELTLATRDLNCQRDGGDDVLAFDVQATFPFVGVQDRTDTPDVDQSGFIAHGLQPQTHYFVNLRVVGPKDFQGNKTYGKCIKTEVKTAALRRPELLTPTNGESGANFHAGTSLYDPAWSWNGLDNPESYELDFWEIDENGTCAVGDPIKSVPGQYPQDRTCQYGACGVRVADLIFPKPTPTGYCWDVVSIARNGSRSPMLKPEDRPRFFYNYPSIPMVSPGLPAHQTISEPYPGDPARAPGALGKDSYDKKVTFTWEAQDDAAQYVLKVQRFPWGEPLGDPAKPGQYAGIPPMAEPDPINCWPAVAPFTPPNVKPSCFYQSPESAYKQGSTVASMTIDPEFAGRGRYCWNVWPIVGQPNDRSEPWSRQPLLDVGSYNCYVTAPAPPELIFYDYLTVGGSCEANNVVHRLAAPFSAPNSPLTIIEGEIHLPFVADGQWQIILDPGAAEDLQWGEPCKVHGPFFNDLYECRMRFTIRAQPKKQYGILVKTFNSDVYPPKMDDSTQAGCAMGDFTLGECGKGGEACCNDLDKYHRCEKDTSCQGGKCLFCGSGLDSNMACCEDGCHAPGLTCHYATMKCETCGGPGQLCCEHQGNDSTCNDGSPCTGLDARCPDTTQPPTGTGGSSGGTNCNALPAPTLLEPGITSYQQFCIGDGGMTKYDEDLSFPTCALAVTPKELFDAKILPCHSSVGFSWSTIPGVDWYTVYIKPIASPGLPERPVQVFRDQKGPFFIGMVNDTPLAPGQTRAYQVAVRAQTCNGSAVEAAPAALGMIATNLDCGVGSGP